MKLLSFHYRHKKNIAIFFIWTSINNNAVIDFSQAYCDGIESITFLYWIIYSFEKDHFPCACACGFHFSFELKHSGNACL